MKKKEYTDLITNKPWQWMSEHFDKLEKFVPVKIAKCNINPEVALELLLYIPKKV